MSTVADYIVESLVASGVTRVYGLSGDSLNGFTDALRRNGKITWVHVRHEENAALAAAADAAVTGELAVCVGSCGPGNLHLINGLFDAHRTRVPVLALAAQIPGSEIGSEYFQETHPQDIFRECSAYREIVSRPEDAPRILGIAMRSALEQRDVAVMVIPGEVLLGKADSGLEPLQVSATRSSVLPDDAGIAAAVNLLDGTDRVTILAGAGCAGAHDEVVELAGRLKAPVVHSLRGKEYLEYDNPYDVGLTGLLGFASGYKAIDECEVLLMLGTDFPYRQFYPEHAKVIQVDLRGEHLGRRAPLTLGLTGDVKSTTRALLGKVAGKASSAHLDRAAAHYARTRKSLDDLAVNDRDRSPVHPQYVARVIDELAADDAVFTTDVGSPVVWASRYLTMNGRRRLLGSFNHGSMGTAVPHAIGAQAIDPERQVVALAGDGGLTMSFGELWTAVQMNLPIKIVVFNNGALAFVELEMKAVGIVNYGTDLHNPELAPVAAAIGFDAHRVEHPSQLEPALRAALAHPGPAFVEVMTARQELSIPPAITLEQAKGFTLFAIRTILSGRGEELLDLVTTNVARRILQ